MARQKILGSSLNHQDSRKVDAQTWIKKQRKNS